VWTTVTRGKRLLEDIGFHSESRVEPRKTDGINAVQGGAWFSWPTKLRARDLYNRGGKVWAGKDEGRGGGGLLLQ